MVKKGEYNIFSTKSKIEESTFEVNNNEDLFNLPANLPDSAILKIKYEKFKSISEIPRDLSNLEMLEIKSKYLQNLIGLPESLPALRSLQIESYPDFKEFNLNSDVDKFNSFKGMPQNLPELRQISLIYSELQNFDHLPQILPNLEHISLKNQSLPHFLGFPQEIPKFKFLSFEYCDIYSFEGLPQPKFEFNTNSPYNVIFETSKIYSLTGLTRSWFNYIIKQLFNDAGSQEVHLYSESDNSFRRVYEIFKLSSKGMKLLRDCIQHEVFNQYFPTFEWSLHRYKDKYTYWNNQNKEEWGKKKGNYNLGSSEWIDGYELADRLFIDENLNLLYEYYKNTPLEIAYQYRDKPNRISQDQIERLKTEADYRVLKVLEPFVPADDPVLNYLISKLSIKTASKKKILL